MGVQAGLLGGRGGVVCGLALLVGPPGCAGPVLFGFVELSQAWEGFGAGDRLSGLSPEFLGLLL